MKNYVITTNQRWINQAEQVEEQLAAIKDNYEKRHDMIMLDSTNSSENDANNDMEDMSSVEDQLGPCHGQSDDQSVETDKILFADTLLKYFDKRTECGKTNYEWDGKPDQLKDFITLILKRDGQWKSKKVSGGKQMGQVNSMDFADLRKSPRNQRSVE